MKQLSPRLMNWASILEDGTREQAEDGGHAVHLPSPRPDAGRSASRQGVVREAIERSVPLMAGAANQHINREHTQELLTRLEERADKAGFDPGSYAGRWKVQLGTLGSGNHFIELTVDEQGRVWLFLHFRLAGSGQQDRPAPHRRGPPALRALVDQPDRDLAYLVEGMDEFWAYIRQMRWAQDYALANREEMMDRVVTCVAEWVGSDVERQEEIGCHHNYTESEKHLGTQV